MFKLALKIFLLFTLIVVLIIIGISSGIINISKINNDNSAENKTFFSRLEDIGNLKLVTFEVNYVVKDTIKNDTSEIKINSKQENLLAIINGRVDACINLGRIKKEDIKENKDTAYIKLPMPVLCNTEINYNQSIIFDASFSSRILNQNFINRHFPNTENNLKAEAIRLGILDRAKENAIILLKPIIEETFKENVVINFEED
jgi:hypothetical protein